MEIISRSLFSQAVWVRDDNGEIVHNGTEYGYLYVIDEDLIVDKDIYQHPRTTMDQNVEFLTKRPLKVRLIAELPVNT